MIEAIHRWQQVACPAEGEAVTFSFTQQFPSNSQIPAHDYEGFAVCFKGKVTAYRNSCPHMGSPLDWLPNQFFSEDGSQLVCHTHDARFDPATGDCLSGPCPHGLETVPLRDTRPNSIEVPAELTSVDQ
ncbi:MAG: Rieske 2Fe-2S domain-containing protein [Mariprofundaceae bacterium]